MDKAFVKAIDDIGQSVRLLDHTTLDTFERCEVEAVYKYRDHIESGRPSAALTFGSAVHAGIRAFYDAAPYVQSAVMLDAVTAAWGTAEFPDDEWRTLAYARDVVAMYTDVYKPSSWDFSLVMNEEYLEDGEECGIVDRVVRRKLDGLLFVRDTKTTGWWPSPAWQEQWRHSQQAARYLALAEAKLGRSIAGFWGDVIYTNKRGYPKREDFVSVGPFQYSAALRAELAEQRARKGARLRRVFAGEESPLKNTHNCFRFNSQCCFLRFCVADPADRADMLQLAAATGELRTKEWNPKERD